MVVGAKVITIYRDCFPADDGLTEPLHPLYELPASLNECSLARPNLYGLRLTFKGQVISGYVRAPLYAVDALMRWMSILAAFD